MSSYVLKSKERELCLAVYLSLAKNIRDFVSKLRSYFGLQQKEVISNIKKDNIALYSFYDVEKYKKKLTSIYSEQVVKVMKKGLDRASAESGVEYDKDFIEFLAGKYAVDTISYIVDKIELTTRKKLNDYYIQYSSKEITKSEFIDLVNQYYNSDCKGWRAKEIALTEVYRIYNFSYFTFMVANGYVWKKIIACFNSKESKTKEIDGQVLFYLEEFVIPSYPDCRGLYPPLHPNSRAILLCLNERT
jgi:hypothetical protein